MKNLIYILLTFIITFSSCSKDSPYKESRKLLKGKWSAVNLFLDNNKNGIFDDQRENVGPIDLVYEFYGSDKLKIYSPTDTSIFGTSLHSNGVDLEIKGYLQSFNAKIVVIEKSKLILRFKEINDYYFIEFKKI